MRFISGASNYWQKLFSFSVESFKTFYPNQKNNYLAYDVCYNSSQKVVEFIEVNYGKEQNIEDHKAEFPTIKYVIGKGIFGIWNA